MQVHVKAFGELSPAELYAILRLRVSVFMLEQNCLYPDLDGLDPQALHVWLEEDGELAAYLRVLDRGVRTEDVMIGRVIAVKRGCGLGARVMREGILTARERFGAGRICLEAQVYAQGFYEKLGFRRVSEPFDEDGIPHVKMVLE